MLQRTHEKIVNIFQLHNGYMTYTEMLREGMTVVQMRELEDRGILQRFARGCYWCRECGLDKPENYRYIEIGISNPKAVVCLASACYLNGLTEKETEPVCVATERTDRRNMVFDFPVNRFYLQNTGIEGEIITEETEYGKIRYYSLERTICDCLRMKNKVGQDIYKQAVKEYLAHEKIQEKVLEYAEKLRAVRNVKRLDENIK